MNISDEEVKAAIEAWFGDFTPPSNYNKDMRRALKAALRVRKRRKREAKQLRPDEVPAAQAEYDRVTAPLAEVRAPKSLNDFEPPKFDYVLLNATGC